MNNEVHIPGIDQTMKAHAGRCKRVGILVTCVLIFACSVQAQDIRILKERITLHEDGSADVAVHATLTSATFREVIIPCNFKSVSDPLVERGSAYSAALTHLREVNQIMVRASDSTLPGEIVLSYTVPQFIDPAKSKPGAFGNSAMSYRFINTTTSIIGHYEGEIDLLSGMVVSSVIESDPELTEKDPVVPYWVDKRDDRRTITIRSDKLVLGGSAFISFRFKPEQKSTVLFIGLTLIGCLYMVFFRDVLKDPNGASGANGKA